MMSSEKSTILPGITLAAYFLFPNMVFVENPHDQSFFPHVYKVAAEDF